MFQREGSTVPDIAETARGEGRLGLVTWWPLGSLSERNFRDTEETVWTRRVLRGEQEVTKGRQGVQVIPLRNFFLGKVW